MLYKWNWFCFWSNLIQPPPPPTPLYLQPILKKKLFPAFFKVSVSYLFDNLEPGKRNYWFAKKSGISMKRGVFPPSPLLMLKLHLLAEWECAPLIRSRCYNIQMWLLINFILMEFGLFCLSIISRFTMRSAIFNFSFQIRCHECIKSWLNEKPKFS